MTIFIYSKSESFKEHINKVLGTQVSHRSDLSAIKANDADMLLIQASSYSDLQLTQVLRDQVALTIAIADEMPDLGKMLRYTNLGVNSYCNAYMAKAHYEQLMIMLEQGNSWFPPELLSQALAVAHSSVRPEENDEQLIELTARQKQIALCIADGKSNKMVADECGIAEGTVKSHVTQIYNKLNVTDRLGLVVYLKRLNLLASTKRKVE